MTKKQIKKSQIIERIFYLEMELLHEGYHDGWVIEGMKKELKKLKKSLTNIVK
tara:strand:- start:1613 stop:1771 length:159 start_codon:yes stop_codon:yes gene_type:complete